jgi:hypothetical protein
MTGHESSGSPPGELRTLSAEDTELAKVVTLFVGLLYVVIMTLAAGFAGVPLSFPLLPAPLIALAVWSAFRMKEVETDGTCLFVSTMSQTMRLPLSWVESVETGGSLSRATVTVVFRQSTPFGSEIVFKPRGHWIPFASGREIADELCALVARAKAVAAPGSGRASEGDR